MHVIRQSVLSPHSVGEARRSTRLRATAGEQFANPELIYLKPLSVLDTASLHLIGVSKVAEFRLMTRLCGVRERWRDTLEDTFFTKIGGFLACDTQRSPRHRFQPPL